MSTSKKKRVRKKSKKSRSADSVPAYAPRYSSNFFESEEKRLLEKLKEKSDWVFVELKLLNWSYANFTLLIRTGTTLAQIARKIEEKHGRIHSLALFRSPPHKKNELTDFSFSLDKIGITGGTVDEAQRAVLFYDFKPALTGPLLLKEPNLMIAAARPTDDDAKKDGGEENF
jgi:hypothetical protein